MTISRCSFLSDQPCFMNSTASQSSSSGWDGGVALVAEILDGADDAAAEEGRPLAVDLNARGQRILRRNEPAGEG